MSSECRHLLDIADLSASEILAILEDAQREPPAVFDGRPRVALFFETPSLRTRVGFAAAAAMLSGSHFDVMEQRRTPAMSQAESVGDTLRCLTGMVDVVVTRTATPLDRALVRSSSVCPVVNGGDPGGEHPTQALIDLFAMQRLAGPLDELHVGVCGDLTLRAVRSLLRGLALLPPARLTLIAPSDARAHGVDLTPVLGPRVDTRAVADFTGLDVLYMGGLPRGSGAHTFSASQRVRYSLNPRTLSSLPPGAVVLSPMPVIDEIDEAVKTDPRIKMHEQSDWGVQVRTAVLRFILQRQGVSEP